MPLPGQVDVGAEIAGIVYFRLEELLATFLPDHNVRQMLFRACAKSGQGGRRERTQFRLVQACKPNAGSLIESLADAAEGIQTVRSSQNERGFGDFLPQLVFPIRVGSVRFPN